MRKLRVLYTSSARQMVSAAARVADEVDYMIQRGHSAEVICRSGYSVASQASRRCLPYTKVKMYSKFSGFYELQDIIMIRKRIKEFNPDIIHAHHDKDHWLAALALASTGKKIPLLRTRHDLSPLTTGCLNRRLYGKATNGLICVSEAVRRQTAKSESIIHCPIKTIKGGVNPAFITPPKEGMVAKFKERYHIQEDAQIVSCLARLAPGKGQDVLLKAIPEILKRRPKTIFLFSFPRKSLYAQSLLTMADNLKIKNSIRWIGDLDSLGVFFESTNVGVVPSVKPDGWNRSAAEFLYYGIPVVASETGCLPEIVHDSVNGLTYESTLHQDLASKICALLDSPLLVVELGNAGRKMIQEELSFSHTIDKLEAFYTAILRSSIKSG